MDKILKEMKLWAGEDIRDIEEIPWSEHPKFKGVAMKHLFTGKHTDGRLSCHLVRVKEGCEIGVHVHPTQYELHEVVSGEGRCESLGKCVTYVPGVCGMFPDNVEHRVVAEKGDLYLLAKFAPALL